ncbi:hypothetical protein V3481_012566 [Fusarium oxysporum f. sp. vasinfectum]
MARKLEAAEARDTAYGEQNILFAHQPMDRVSSLEIFLLSPKVTLLEDHTWRFCEPLARIFSSISQPPKDR